MDKIKILELRNQGYGYKKIAQILNVPLNSVKSFLRRNETTCNNCGKSIKQSVTSKPKKFCSKECCVRWWNAHPDQVKRKAIYQITCAHCGKEFSSYGFKDRKYCSHECYIKKRYGVS